MWLLLLVPLPDRLSIVPRQNGHDFSVAEMAPTAKLRGGKLGAAAFLRSEREPIAWARLRKRLLSLGVASHCHPVA
jgi:hypothetical protein